MNDYQVFIEKSMNFDAEWVKDNKDFINKINKAVETGDETFLDKAFRIVCSSGFLIGMCTLMGAVGGNPLSMTASGLGAVIGSVIGGLIGEKVFDKKGIIRVTDYQQIIRTNIKAMEQFKRKLDPKEDADKIKNIDTVLKSLRKADVLCDKKLESLREYAISPERVQYIFESTVLL